MEANEGKPTGSSLKEQKSAKGSLRSRFKETWLGRNWTTVLVLVGIIFLAIFVRTYFGYSTAVGNNDFLVAGGSDSYYHMRVIDHVEATGSHLVDDPLLNYGIGVRNERPPLYDWTVAVTSMFLSGISGISLTITTGYTLLWSTVFWSALTCIPLFLLTRAAFGTKAGLLATLLFALMPGNIQRSIFADADHDAMILFFVVFALYFLLKALMSINGTKWVSNWKSFGSIRQGLRTFLSQNNRSLIYSLLGGVCIGTIAMVWTGYTYIIIIVLVYFLVQILINRFRNVDSMGELMVVGTMLLSAFLLMAPLYWQLRYWNQWFDVPFYLFLATMIVGAIFVVSRDYPWTLVLPVIAGLIIVGLVGIFFVAPNIFDAIVTGQGYLVKSKLYDTIQEAQAPAFSDLAMSFGPVTFWFALVGVVWAAVKIPKNPSPYLVFIVVWMGVSMYMAASAARFMFNASPAFAMAAGWILALFIGLFKFEDLRKAFSGFVSHPWTTLRRATKLRHVVAVLFLAFLIVLPNAWGAVDAGIPSETKRDYDRQIYYGLPDFLHPSGYDVVNGTYWYLGAFSYSLPLPDTYWPMAWSWFAQQDQNLSDYQRPAFLSWWDYGFEAVQQGKHPTVADNFQNGYNMAGSFLTAQNESDAIALFIVRVLESTGFNDTTVNILENNGLNDTSTLQDIMAHPSNYVQQVLANPDVYGPYTPDLSAANAKYAAARVELEKVGEDNLVSMYHDLREASGKDIGYVAVDARLFPFSATSSNIFYAPAKLSDRAIDPYTNSPTDYYTIKAIMDDYSVEDVQNASADHILGYQILYTDLFYQTMIYRTFMGISPADIGADTQGIPGVSGSLRYYDAMPAYNLTHFKQVYRTAYYNPYEPEDVANHTDAWQAIAYEDAQYRQAQIEAGKMNGTVDLSAASLESGVVFIQYYDGAILNGRATSNDGTPYSGVYVTVVDEFGIPHQTVQTDADGNYQVLLPFGTNVSVVYSVGTLDPTTHIANELSRKTFAVSYAQAQRLEDFNGNGDIVLPAASVSGTAYLDLDNSGSYTPGDQPMAGASIVLENKTTGFKATTVADANGNYSLVGLAGMTDSLYAVYEGHTLGTQSVALTSYSSYSKYIAVKPAVINGTACYINGDPAASIDVVLTDKSTGEVKHATTGSSGEFNFGNLLPGDYNLTTADPSLSVELQTFTVTSGAKLTPTLTLNSASQVSGTVSIGSTPQANVVVSFVSPQRTLSATTDASGHYSLTVPRGTYTVYAWTVQGSSKYVALTSVEATSQTVAKDLSLVQGSDVAGTVKSGDSPVSGATITYTDANDNYVTATTNSSGGYSMVLPSGSYFVYAVGSSKAYWNTYTVSGAATNDVTLVDSATISGKVYRDADGDSTVDSGEGLASAVLRVQSTSAATQKVNFLSGSDGSFSIVLPKSDDGYVLNVSLSGYKSWETTYDSFDGNVNVNIPLEAEARTVTGTVSSGSTPVSGVTISFYNANSGTTTATTNATGGYTVSLKPGTYAVTVDQNVTSGDDSVKYQYDGTITVPVGRDLDNQAIALVTRDKVTGTADLNGGTGTIRFVGPDDKTVNATATLTDLYLQPGEYTVYANVTANGQHYAYLGTANIAPGADLNIVTEPAYALKGTLRYDGSTLSSASTTVTVNSGSAELPVAVSGGTFTIYLVNGTYTVNVDYHTTASVDGINRYVKYSAAQSVMVNGDTNANIDLSRDFDTFQVSGSVSGASGMTLTFTPLSETAMEATATVSGGSYSINLAPGVYSVYGVSGTQVVFATITVTNAAGTESFTLQDGHTVSGTVSYNGSPVNGGNVTFSSAAKAVAPIGADGTYSVLLPNGIYNVTATWIGQEQGVNVIYEKKFDLTVNGANVAKDVSLVRTIHGAVSVVWDDSKETVDAGQSKTYDVTITNLGNSDDTFKLSSDSTWGVTFSQDTVSLGWGNSGTTSKTIQVTIKTPTDAKVKHDLIKIKADSQNNTGASGTTYVDVGITPVYDVTIDTGAPQSYNTTGLTYTLVVTNTGNIVDNYTLSVDSDLLGTNGWDVTIVGSTNDSLQINNLDAGKSQTVTVKLMPNTANPNLNAVMQASISGSATDSTSVTVQKGTIDPSSDLQVSGDGISMNAPGVPGSTWFLVAMIMILLVVLVITRVNKGVFGRRRKR